MYVSLGRELIRQAVARTSERTYQDYFRCWKLFCVSMGLPVFLLAGAGGDSHVRSLLAYIAYTWGTNGLTAGYSWSLGGGEVLSSPRARA